MAGTNILRGLATVSLYSADHETGKAWYTDLLELEPYFDRLVCVEFRLGDY